MTLHTQWDTTLIADVATGVEDFYFREQIQTVTKPRFYPRLCQFLMKIIPVINWVCACVKKSVSNGGLGMCETNDFYLFWEFLHFGLTEKALFQVIWGLLLVYADWEKGGVCKSKSVYVRVFHDLELLRYVLRCAIQRQH